LTAKQFHFPKENFTPRSGISLSPRENFTFIMKTYLKLLPWLLVVVLDFWLLPLFLDAGNVMLMVLIVMPGICFFASLGCGLFCGFRPLFLLCTELLYLPTVWVYYNGSALFYLTVYAAVSLLGLLIGFMIRTGLKREPEDNESET